MKKAIILLLMSLLSNHSYASITLVLSRIIHNDDLQVCVYSHGDKMVLLPIKSYQTCKNTLTVE